MRAFCELVLQIQGTAQESVESIPKFFWSPWSMRLNRIQAKSPVPCRKLKR
jgi:hypothetical protein